MPSLTQVSAEPSSRHTAKVAPLDRVWMRSAGWLPDAAVLKVDVQGFELKLLRGARRFLTQGRVRCVAFEVAAAWLKAQGASPDDLHDELTAAGFDHFIRLDVSCAARFRPCTIEFVRIGRSKLSEADGEYVACGAEAARRLWRGKHRSPTQWRFR